MGNYSIDDNTVTSRNIDNNLSSKKSQPISVISEWLFHHLTKTFALFTLLSLAGIILSLLFASWDSIKEFGIPFLWTDDWNPPAEKFGAMVPIYGTIATSVIALLIAVPVSFGIALFLTELAPLWLRRPLGTAIELLAAIPSIVYGMWGLLIFAPVFTEYFQGPFSGLVSEMPILKHLFSGYPIGIGLLPAGVVLAIMIIPFIASVMRDVFEVVPSMLKESAYGLGATTWEVVWNVVLPYTKGGVIGGVMLGFGRALGETMAVTFVIGNTSSFSSFSLNDPGNSIASLLANEFAEASPGLYMSSLMNLGLILFLITFFVLILSRLILCYLSKKS